MAYVQKKKFELVDISPSKPTAKIGQVLRVNPNGIVYMRASRLSNSLNVCFHRDKAHPTTDFSDSATNKVSFFTAAPDDDIVIFTFDKIKNYAGETAEQIGLKEGIIVEFEAPQGVVESVKLK